KFELIKPPLATDEELGLVHTKDYIKAISTASKGIILDDIYRYVSSDNLNPLTGYIPQDIDEGSRIIVGGAILAGKLIAENEFKKVIGIGGMHHAKPDFGEGFCFYNDIAICVNNLKKKYNLNKILVIDTDAHAGNGTAEIFYSDNEVLFIDIHQHPYTLYPQTGYVNEIGDGKGKGFNVNLPVLPGASTVSYEYIFEEVIIPLAFEFKPEVIIRYGGSDPHYLDELTNLGLTLSGFKMMGEKVRFIAEEITQGSFIDLQLSGYNIEVLPYAWTALICGLLDLDVDLGDFKEETPPSPNARLEETKEMVKELKKILRKYWQCMGNKN
ncbi:MAG: histone deacetylase, partial [Candidatus Omnitrophica bacterium]|nr:histone deacetylase [Candidatus Omnitrophota bacterium]